MADTVAPEDAPAPPQGSPASDPAGTDPPPGEKGEAPLEKKETSGGTVPRADEDAATRRKRLHEQARAHALDHRTTKYKGVSTKRKQEVQKMHRMHNNSIQKKRQKRQKNPRPGPLGAKRNGGRLRGTRSGASKASPHRRNSSGGGFAARQPSGHRHLPSMHHARMQMHPPLGPQAGVPLWHLRGRIPAGAHQRQLQLELDLLRRQQHQHQQQQQHQQAPFGYHPHPSRGVPSFPLHAGMVGAWENANGGHPPAGYGTKTTGDASESPAPTGGSTHVTPSPKQAGPKDEGGDRTTPPMPMPMSMPMQASATHNKENENEPGKTKKDCDPRAGAAAASAEGPAPATGESGKEGESPDNPGARPTERKQEREQEKERETKAPQGEATAHLPATLPGSILHGGTHSFDPLAGGVPGGMHPSAMLHHPLGLGVGVGVAMGGLRMGMGTTQRQGIPAFASFGPPVGPAFATPPPLGGTGGRARRPRVRKNKKRLRRKVWDENYEAATTASGQGAGKPPRKKARFKPTRAFLKEHLSGLVRWKQEASARNEAARHDAGLELGNGSVKAYVEEIFVEADRESARRIVSKHWNESGLGQVLLRATETEKATATETETATETATGKGEGGREPPCTTEGSTAGPPLPPTAAELKRREREAKKREKERLAAERRKKREWEEAIKARMNGYIEEALAPRPPKKYVRKKPPVKKVQPPKLELGAVREIAARVPGLAEVNFNEASRAISFTKPAPGSRERMRFDVYYSTGTVGTRLPLVLPPGEEPPRDKIGRVKKMTHLIRRDVSSPEILEAIFSDPYAHGGARPREGTSNRARNDLRLAQQNDRFHRAFHDALHGIIDTTGDHPRSHFLNWGTSRFLEQLARSVFSFRRIKSGSNQINVPPPHGGDEGEPPREGTEYIDMENGILEVVQKMIQKSPRLSERWELKEKKQAASKSSGGSSSKTERHAGDHLACGGGRHGESSDEHDGNEHEHEHDDGEGERMDLADEHEHDDNDDEEFGHRMLGL